MLEKIKGRSTGKRLVVSLIIFVIMLIPMNAFVSGWSAEQGVTMMGFVFGGYGPDLVNDVLTTIGANGRQTCLHLIALDCVMGLLYLNFLVSLIGFAPGTFPTGRRWTDYLLFLPLVAMLSDWTENFATLSLILSYPQLSAGVVAVESLGTTLKFAFLGISFAVAAVLLVVGLIRRLAQRGR